jgi:hypothetical protein
MLLADRGDVDADSRDESGYTPLSWAAARGHEASVKLLIDRDDTDADSKDIKDRTPLSWTDFRSHTKRKPSQLATTYPALYYRDQGVWLVGTRSIKGITRILS